MILMKLVRNFQTAKIIFLIIHTSRQSLTHKKSLITKKKKIFSKLAIN